MDQNNKIEEAESLKNNLELARSSSDKHLLRPSRYYSMFKDFLSWEMNFVQRLSISEGVVVFQLTDDTAEHDKGKYTLIKDVEDLQVGLYDKPLPCFGCGIGWFSFLFGFVFPFMWYYATFLYFGNYYRKDPRERAGLAASAIAALACSVALLVIVVILLF